MPKPQGIKSFFGVDCVNTIDIDSHKGTPDLVHMSGKTLKSLRPDLEWVDENKWYEVSKVDGIKELILED